MTTITLRHEGETWAVDFGHMKIAGFTTEASAGLWLVQYIVMAVLGKQNQARDMLLDMTAAGRVC